MQTLSSQIDKIPKYDTKNHNAPIPAPGKAIRAYRFKKLRVRRKNQNR